MRSLRITLLPALLAACPAGPDATSATEPTTGTGTTDSTVAPTTDTSTGEPTTSTTVPTTTTTTDVTATHGGPTTDDTTTTTTTGDSTTTDSTTTGDSTTTTTTGDSTTTTGDSTTTTTGDDTTTTTTGMPAECVPGDSEACYTGPPGTEDVGLCKAGQRTCDDEGAWGPCLGEVLPQPENCDVLGDEDCDGDDPCAGDGAHAWSLPFGQGSDDEGVRVAFDPAGNLFLAARNDGGALDFGGGPLVNAGNYDVYLAKFAPDGTHLWSKRFGDADIQGYTGLALATTPAGHVVLGGEFVGTIDFGGGPLQQAQPQFVSMFLAELDAAGDHVWSEAYHSGEDVGVHDLAIAPDGHILLGGYFYVSLDLGGPELVSGGSFDAFVAKLTATGEHVWSRGFGEAEGQIALGVEVDAAGGVYLSGFYYGTIDAGLGPHVSAGQSDIFLFKLDPDGDTAWSRSFGDSQGQTSRSLAIDSKGRVTLCGETSGVVDFGGGPLDVGSNVGYLAQFDGTGAHMWSRTTCAPGSSMHGRVATDGNDNLVLGLPFGGNCDLGGGPLVSAGGPDLLVAKFNATGQHVWSQRFGDASAQNGLDAAGAPDGHVAAAGTFTGTIDFGAGPNASKGGRDGFVAVFGP
ncbi:nucleotide-binding protein [Nannocystis radixulma]|uniref:Nucleotide-binding protein n=1 Tax=Nannocystis radixulma TaxID=2995305 RepID=A0ABT5AZA8_9BACT|nr:nucleotide-binding protein [Nannocystis radixulma]MDC0666629.1 nucleotide-binding protein [Nannocystis radixulma]